MSWREQLQPGSFRGVRFEIDDHDVTGGRRVALHEYPLRDEPYAEDLGRKAREFDVECFVLGPDYMAARDRLLTALEATDAGPLVHPYLGAKSVLVSRYRLRESTRHGGMAQFNISFIEAGRAAAPDVQADTASGVATACDAAAVSAAADFEDNFTVDGLPAFVSESAIGTLEDGISKLRSLNGSIGGALSPISQFSADLDNLGDELGTLIQQPLTLATQVIGVVAALSGVAKDVTGAFNAYRTFWSFGEAVATVTGTTSTRQQQAANQAALHALLQRAATIEAARSAAQRDFDSGESALAVRTLLADQLDVLMEDAGDEVFAALADLRTASVRDLTTRGAQLPRTTLYTPRLTQPALAVAYRLYGDASREADLVARNNIRHPGFVPGGVAIEALTDVA